MENFDVTGVSAFRGSMASFRKSEVCCDVCQSSLHVSVGDFGEMSYVVCRQCGVMARLRTIVDRYGRVWFDEALAKLRIRNYRMLSNTAQLLGVTVEKLSEQRAAG